MAHFETLQAVLASAEYPPANANSAHTALTEFESIQDPESATAYFRQHKDAINSELDARRSSENNVN
jgi:hypothetical protein